MFLAFMIKLRNKASEQVTHMKLKELLLLGRTLNKHKLCMPGQL